MDLKKVGKLIKEARVASGYTQKSFANTLCISDKAVSKWERGLSFPDSYLLPKISMLLDIDIDYLIPNQIFNKDSEWCGKIIYKNNSSIKENTLIYDKPLIFYQLSYFMLAGITNIIIKGCNKNYINSLKLEKYGLNISFDDNNIKNKNMMLIEGNYLLFGVNLTRKFKSCMDYHHNIQMSVDNIDIPLYFCVSENESSKDKKTFIQNQFGRGTLFFPITNKKQKDDVSTFVRIYQNNHKILIADLREIAYKRNLLVV